MLKAPWTDDEVAALNAYQQNPYYHPYTCGGEKCRQDLIATTEGWKCPSCGYTQDWANRMSILLATDNPLSKPKTPSS